MTKGVISKREKIARWLRTYKLGEIEVDAPTDDGIVPWDKASEKTRDYWLKDADRFMKEVEL